MVNFVLYLISQILDMDKNIYCMMIRQYALKNDLLVRNNSYFGDLKKQSNVK